MSVIVRFERRADADAIRSVTESAFAGAEHSDGTEAEIPGRLREAGGLRLSLIAEDEGEVVGHIAFSPATVGGDAGWMALGPVSVRPDRQGQGIGSKLIEGGLAQIRRDAAGCVLLGDPAYYARFGFRPADRLRWGEISAPYLQILSFSDADPAGTVSFHPAFGADPADETALQAGPLEGRCDCGAVTIRVPIAPDRINACPCDYCRRAGARWAYYPAETVIVEGGTVPYRRAARALEFHRCGVCGIVTHWADPLGKLDKVGVNTVVFDPDLVAGVAVVAEA